MSSSQNESALEKFVEKIDFAKLEGKPEDFYEAGLTFVENGQFDDGIIEFVKIIKTISYQDSLFVDAVKELKSMGFSDTDIDEIAGIPKSEKELNTTLVPADSTENDDAQNKPRINTGGLIAYYVVILLVFVFSCPWIIFGEAVTGNKWLRDAAIIFILLLIAPVFFTKKSQENQIDLLPMAFIGGIVVIVIILLSIFR